MQLVDEDDLLSKIFRDYLYLYII